MGTTSAPRIEAPVTESLAPDLSGTRPTQRSAIYWCGVRGYVEGDPRRPHPPMHDITVGGVTFMERYQPWEDHREGEDKRGSYPGLLLRLTEDRVARLKSALRRTVVRWREREGRHAHGYLVTVPEEGEVEQARKRWGLTEAQVAAYQGKIAGIQFLPGDEPVGRYLYCLRVEEAPGVVEMGTYRPAASIPPSVLETGILNP